MKKIDVCLSPELIHLYTLESTIVVVVDIFRATSCMVTAFAHGVQKIYPVATVTECSQLQAKGYLAAAERDAHKVEGFELDNSPFSYMADYIKNSTIAVTTTNGTLAITKSKTAEKVIIGAFLNIETVASFVKNQNFDVLIHCAGWKGKPNLEDTLFAGALIDLLKNDFELAEDSALMALKLYELKKDRMLEAVTNSSHVKRLQKLGIEKDISFCLQRNLYNVLPILEGEKLTLGK